MSAFTASAQRSSHFSGKKKPGILLTGASGMVGSHLLLELVRSGKEVLALKRPDTNTEMVPGIWAHYGSKEEIETWFSRVHWKDADLLDNSSLRSCMEGIEAVYHVAAMVSFHPRNRKEMLAFNTGSTRLLVNLSLEYGIKSFAFLSSVSSLGAPLYGKASDESLIGVPDHRTNGYALSKFLSENEVWRGSAEGLPVVIVNPTVILGPGDWGRGSTRFFPAVWDGLKYYTGGGTGFVDVRDVAKVLVNLVEKSLFGERFVLSGGELSYKELLSLIARELGKPSPSKKASRFLLESLWRLEALRSGISGKEPLITSETARISRRFSRFSSEKVQKSIDFVFRTPEETIRDTARFFLEDLNKS